MNHHTEVRSNQDGALAAREVDLLDLVLLLAEHWRLLVVGPTLAGLIAMLATLAISPTYTAVTTFLPPQMQQSSAAAALQSLGALAGVAGAAAGLKNPGDQYVALMKSDRVSDRIIDQFDLMGVYDKEFRIDARKVLLNNVSISVGKQDGLIRIEVEDGDPGRAAAMANRYVEELRLLLAELAITEAQQRRKFFEEKLNEARHRLAEAQKALQASGFSEGVLRAEPRAAADEYANLKAQVTAAEVRLQALRSQMTEQAPEVQRALAELGALREQLRRAEMQNQKAAGGDYIDRYRDFKYWEALFELFARQYELARVDESREGLLVQVVDEARPPEKKSGPRRVLITVGVGVGTGVVLFVWVMIVGAWRHAARDPESAGKIARLREFIRWRRADRVG